MLFLCVSLFKSLPVLWNNKSNGVEVLRKSEKINQKNDLQSLLPLLMINYNSLNCFFFSFFFHFSYSIFTQYHQESFVSVYCIVFFLEGYFQPSTIWFQLLNDFSRNSSNKQQTKKNKQRMKQINRISFF